MKPARYLRLSENLLSLVPRLPHTLASTQVGSESEVGKMGIEWMEVQGRKGELWPLYVSRYF